jgi:hypothetical protein
LISLIANTMRMEVKGGKDASDGTGAPSATLRAQATAAAASGMPRATTYQIHPTRQRIIREPSSRSPAQPWVMGITMRAARIGPGKRGEGDRPTAYSGQVHHDRTKVRTKNVMSG